MVTSYLQLLKRRYGDKLDENADEFIGFAVDGSQRMHNLIDALLAYSRVGTRGKDPVETDCEEVFEAALSNLRLAIEECAAEVTHDPLPRVLSDDTQMIQLFQNLIGNALKFRGDKTPRVHVSAERDGDRFKFCVRDNGIGIDSAQAERIFLVFQRLHARDEYEGTGIGLAICQKIVERHGGKIWVESKAGEGAVFFFTLPVAPGS